MDTFDNYVKPLFPKSHYIVDNYLQVKDSDNHKAVLISIRGDGFLERVVNDALIEAKKVIDETEINKISKAEVSGRIYHRSAWGFNVVSNDKGIYDLIGAYEDEKTASQLFPLIAQTYLSNRVDYDINKLSAKLKSFMGKKLSDF